MINSPKRGAGRAYAHPTMANKAKTKNFMFDLKKDNNKNGNGN